MTAGRRLRTVIAAAVAVVVGLAVVAGILILRDADDGSAAEVGATRVTAAVERRALEAVLTLPGTYHLDGPMSVRVPEGGDASRRVVTSVPFSVGDRVTAGSMVIEVNYRPVLLLQSALPPYRDLRPGTIGPDVANIQAGLRSLGHEIPEEETATFGPVTQDAVRAVYEAAGHEPDYTEGSAEATDSAIRAARDQADAAYRMANEAHLSGGDATELVAEYHRAQAAADEFERSSGVMLRVDTIVTTTETALTVGGVSVSEGQPVEPGSPAMLLSAGDTVLRASLSAQQANLLASGPAKVIAPPSDCAVGDPIEATDDHEAAPSVDDAGIIEDAPDPSTSENTITIDGDTGGDGANARPGTDSLQVTVHCEAPPSIDLAGSDTVVTISVEVTGPESLVVPATALIYESDGTAAVIVSERGEETRTGVEVVAEANGFVAIEAADSGIREGARVVVNE